MSGFDLVQGLWIGGSLSKMERLSINSFLKNGHSYHLYTYPDASGNLTIGNVPLGVVLKDANEIIPQDQVFLVRGGYSTFSDFFRWRLILEKGGWWVDLDTICLKPFDFAFEHVFIGGKGLVGSDDCITSGMFRAPAQSEIMKWGWARCQEMDPKTMSWGQAGPPLFTVAVHKFGLLDTVVPGRLFFPVFYTRAPAAFIDRHTSDDYGDSYSVHLFNEMWRLAGVDKTAIFPENCAYEKLKRRFGA